MCFLCEKVVDDGVGEYFYCKKCGFVYCVDCCENEKYQKEGDGELLSSCDGCEMLASL